LFLTKEALILVFTLSGINLKLADFYGERGGGYLRHVFAAIAAVCMGLLISGDSPSSSIVLGIIIGVTLAGKLDKPNMMIGLALTLATATILGFSLPDFPLLIAITIASLIDEVGHDKIASRGILTRFFHFRMALKIVIIFLTVLTWVDVLHALGFFCFDLSYDVTSILLVLHSDKRKIEKS